MQDFNLVPWRIVRPNRKEKVLAAEPSGAHMRFTIPLLAALCIASAVPWANLRAQELSPLAQEYQKVLKESGQISNFRDAKTDEERKKAVETLEQFARRFVKLVETHPNDPLALEVLTQTVRAMNSTDSAIQMSWQTNKTSFPTRSKEDPTELVMSLLARDHMKSDQLWVACERMRYGTRNEYATFLRKVLKESPHHEVRGVACLALAQFLQSQAARLNLLAEQPELAKRYEAMLGKEYLEALRQKGHDGLTEEVEALLEQASSQYGEVTMPWGGTVGQQAETALFEIRHLAVGKEVADIEGKDQDCEPFKLSAYRGKVVLLYFWSEY